MTQDKIIRMAREAGFINLALEPKLTRFAALITAQLMSESASICAERDWVDLTDDEINNAEYWGGSSAVIAAFKEKNK